jgi:hypothetical protein
MTGTRLPVELGAEAEARRVIDAMRAAVAAGDEHWFLALLEAVRLWPLAQECVGDRHFRYLIGGEAFDWLLLAERLCEEIDGLVPEDEAEGLLFHGWPPIEVGEQEFRRLLGAKYRAHLNFIYGVHVEMAIQLAAQQEVRKERLSIRIWENGHIEDEAFHRIYGSTRSELLQAFREGREENSSANMSLSDLDEFTYWLFRYRVQNSDPARVASDTRKGMALYQWLEERRKRGCPAARTPGPAEA